MAKCKLNSLESFAILHLPQHLEEELVVRESEGGGEGDGVMRFSML